MNSHPESPSQQPSFSTGKPGDDEIDVYGITHVGHVREENQDHFLICSLRRAVDIVQTSLPHPESIDGESDRVAFMAMVADGVGGGPKGEEASRLTVAGVTRYVAEGMHVFYSSDPSDEEAFTRALTEAALRCHEDLRRRGEEDPTSRDMATTLSLYLGVWPVAYLLQVGDSRYYLLRDGVLTQVSRDQTIAQELVDRGIFSQTSADDLPWSNVLSSVIGGSQTSPVVTRIENSVDNVHLLCSDGLTKHVPVEKIRDRLLNMTSAREACEQLLQDALDGGGTDNITMIIGRVVPKSSD